MTNKEIIALVWIAIMGLFWLGVTSINAWLIWRKLVKKEKRVPSMIPLVGGFFAYFIIQVLPICQICPFRSGFERFLLFILMGTLDFGSIPYLVLALYGALPWFKNNKI